MIRVLGPLALAATAAGLLVLATRDAAPADAPRPGQPLAHAPSPDALGTLPASAAHTTPGTAPAAPARTAGCDLQPGARLAYQVKAASSSTMAAAVLGAQADAPVEFNASLEGRLDWEVLSRGEHSAVLVGQFADVVITGTTFSAGDLAPSFLVEVGDDCSLKAFARAKDTAVSAARNAQALVWETQFAWADASRRFTGRNATGEYEGTLGPSLEGRLERQARTYTKLWASPAAPLATSALLVIEPGAGPWFERAKSTERYTLEGRSVASSLSLVRAPARDVTPSRGRDVDGYVWEDLLPVRVDERPVRQVTTYDLERRARVANQSLEQALTGLAEREASGNGIQDVWPDLSAWFEVHPEGIAPAVQRLQAGQVPPEAIADFYLALGKARTPVARDTLLSLRRSPTEPPMDRVRATMALVDRDDVGLELAQELASETSVSAAASKADVFLAGESMLALSIMSGLKREPQTVALTRETLTAVLAQPGPAARTALAAVGNTGDPTLLAVATPATQQPDFQTRMAAAAIFRRMPIADSEPMALEWLARETHPFVKRRLYEVLRLQYFDAQVPASEALTRQAMKDLPETKNPIARKTMIRFIASGALKNEPAFREFLKAQARYEHLHNTGVLNEFTEVLTPAEVWEVLK